eukprot:TRINITY_DN14739_c0_g2_i1.p1 TRINITY_DN14739_c0_g2~~TRINITY_DN14739_c0_g2_i1.p1  ORF type:complete len:336 (-),score=37.81 TRINITY_DN14739_c0_g2_i1:59-997(-)
MAFTCCHLCLSLLVFLMVLAVIIILFFFMVVVLSWPLGAIELISLIVFVGYAATFCLHIAHAYSEPWDEELEELSKLYSDSDASETAEAKSPEAGGAPMRDEGLAQEAGDDGIPSPPSPVPEASPARPAGPSEPPTSLRISNDMPALEILDDDQRHDAGVPDHHVDIPFSPALPNGGQMSPVSVGIGQTSRLTRLRTNKELRIWQKTDALARTHRALSHLGGAILSSALSTVASSSALFLCTLTFFPTLGIVLITVTVLSLVAALVLMPAVLVTVRPEPNSYVSLLTESLRFRLKRLGLVSKFRSKFWPRSK